jgi:hypothetical protein
LTLLVTQGFLAKHIGSLEYARLDEETAQLVKKIFGRKKVKALVANDANPFYTGGVCGLPGRERLEIPKLWLRAFNREQLRAILLRKQGVIINGSRTRGGGVRCKDNQFWNSFVFATLWLNTGRRSAIAYRLWLMPPACRNEAFKANAPDNL